MPKHRRSLIFTASEEELSSPNYYLRLWLAARNAPISRRAWLDAIADCLRDFEGHIVNPDGSPFSIPLVDDIFPEPGMRWMSEYLRADMESGLPKLTSEQFERIRLIDLYFRIAHPQIAQHFGR